VVGRLACKRARYRFLQQNGFRQVGEIAFPWGDGEEVGYVLERLAPF
jgi:hypothetical protein